MDKVELIAQSRESGLRVYQYGTRILFIISGLIVAECHNQDYIAGAAYFAALA